MIFYYFRQLIDKLTARFAFVGLTDLADKFTHLNRKCITAQDLVLYEIEIQQLILRMLSCTKALKRFQTV
jgi:hypothetical protein